MFVSDRSPKIKINKMLNHNKIQNQNNNDNNNDNNDDNNNNKVKKN